MKNIPQNKSNQDPKPQCFDNINNDDQVNESIQNWDLHLKLMEKKYGKRKIETELKYKKFL